VLETSIFNPAVVVLAVSIILAVISRVLQRKFVDRQKMNAYKAEIKEKQKKMKEMMKGGNNAELAKLQKEMLAVNSKMMQMSMKVTWISLPIFLVSFAAMGFFYGGISFEALFPLPSFTAFSIINPASWLPTGMTIMTGYYKAYFFSYLIATIILVIAEKVYDKVLKKK